MILKDEIKTVLEPHIKKNKIDTIVDKLCIKAVKWVLETYDKYKDVDIAIKDNELAALLVKLTQQEELEEKKDEDVREVSS